MFGWLTTFNGVRDSRLPPLLHHGLLQRSTSQTYAASKKLTANKIIIITMANNDKKNGNRERVRR